MNENTKYEPGTFCWAELGTTDGASAKKFYTELFGWTFKDEPVGQDYDEPIGSDRLYTMLKSDEKVVAALFTMAKEESEQGIPPHWSNYIAVDSADEYAQKAKELGATVAMGPFDVMEFGRMALIQDPTGAFFSIWEGRKHIGAKLLGPPVSMCWNELATNDTEKAGEFYTKLFNWGKSSRDMGGFTYTEFKRKETSAAGMMEINEEMKGVPPHWMVYFSVQDCDQTIEKTQSLGGKIATGPIDIPNVGRFAIATDPQGAAFAFISSPQ